MSNSYLCDECEGKSFDWSSTECMCHSVDDVVQKIVLPDGYQEDQKKLCAHWKERE